MPHLLRCQSHLIAATIFGRVERSIRAGEDRQRTITRLHMRASHTRGNIRRSLFPGLQRNRAAQSIRQTMSGLLIRTFYDPGKKISLYVFGDEFTGESIAQVIDTVDRINRADAEGNRLVRIHAVGFPVQFIRAPHLQTTGIRFATLMRELTFRNGGTFVALNDFRN